MDHTPRVLYRVAHPFLGTGVPKETSATQVIIQLVHSRGGARSGGMPDCDMQLLRTTAAMRPWWLHFNERSYQTRVASAEGGAALEVARPVRRGVPLASHAQFGFGVAAGIVALASFFPQVINPSEVKQPLPPPRPLRQFFLGAVVGLFARVAASRLASSRRSLLARPPRWCSPRRC